MTWIAKQLLGKKTETFQIKHPKDIVTSIEAV
jgi:hypothetical protein